MYPEHKQTPVVIYDNDHFDIELEELTDVSLEWWPLAEESGNPTGGRYVLTIESDGRKRDIWASPAQMTAIQHAINAVLVRNQGKRISKSLFHNTL